MNIIKNPAKETWDEILKRPAIDTKFLERSVANILDDVSKNGDEALKYCARHFDKVELDEFLVTEEEFAEAEAQISPQLKDAIAVAKANIEKFHAAQIEKPEIIETTKGVFCWRKNVPIEKVGLIYSGGNCAAFFDRFDARRSCKNRRMQRNNFMFAARRKRQNQRRNFIFGETLRRD